MYNGVGYSSIRGTGVTGAVHRSVATLVRSSKEDYIKWKETQEQSERTIDPKIIKHKHHRVVLAEEYEKKF